MSIPAGTPRAVAPGGYVLRVTELRLSAGRLELLHGVSFTVGPRERVGIIGASGSGKTLTCMAVAGLLPDGLHASGSIELAGFGPNMIGSPERRLASARGRLVGMVFQEPMTALNPTMKVGRQVAEVMMRHHTVPSRAAARAAVLDLLTSTGLPAPGRIAGSYPHQLSGGQRQRVVLAIALANNPALLICDEPTTALDVSVQAKVLDLIGERAGATGSALLFISHDLAVVAQVCDRILVMYDGDIVESGTTVDVLSAPKHPHTRRLLADADLTARPA